MNEPTKEEKSFLKQEFDWQVAGAVANKELNRIMKLK
jgi:hypothetical protein